MPVNNALNNNNEDNNSNKQLNIWSVLSTVICIALIMIALYFAFRCKDMGVLDILAAICCSPCYIAYRLARPDC